MKLFDLIFGVDGAEKADKSYEEHLKARRDLEDTIEEAQKKRPVAQAAEDVLSIFEDRDVV